MPQAQRGQRAHDRQAGPHREVQESQGQRERHAEGQRRREGGGAAAHAHRVRGSLRRAREVL